MLMRITAIEIILSCPRRGSRGICWEIIQWCLFSTRTWGSRAASAAGGGFAAALDGFLPCPCQRGTGEGTLCRGLRAAATLFPLHSTILVLWQSALFYLLPSVCIVPPGVRRVGTWWGADRGRRHAWNPGWLQRGVLKDAECAGLFPGPRLPWDMSQWWTSRRWFGDAGERCILCFWDARLVWWRGTKWVKCRLRAKTQDVTLWGDLEEKMLLEMQKQLVLPSTFFDLLPIKSSCAECFFFLV